MSEPTLEEHPVVFHINAAMKAVFDRNPQSKGGPGIETKNLRRADERLLEKLTEAVFWSSMGKRGQ